MFSQYDPRPLSVFQGAEGWEANDWRFDEDAERSMGLRPMGRANEAKATWQQRVLIALWYGNMFVLRLFRV